MISDISKGRGLPAGHPEATFVLHPELGGEHVDVSAFRSNTWPKHIFGEWSIKKNNRNYVNSFVNVLFL